MDIIKEPQNIDTLLEEAGLPTSETLASMISDDIAVRYSSDLTDSLQITLTYDPTYRGFNIRMQTTHQPTIDRLHEDQLNENHAFGNSDNRQAADGLLYYADIIPSKFSSGHIKLGLIRTPSSDRGKGIGSTLRKNTYRLAQSLAVPVYSQSAWFGFDKWSRMGSFPREEVVLNFLADLSAYPWDKFKKEQVFSEVLNANSGITNEARTIIESVLLSRNPESVLLIAALNENYDGVPLGRYILSGIKVGHEMQPHNHLTDLLVHYSDIALQSPKTDNYILDLVAQNLILEPEIQAQLQQSDINLLADLTSANLSLRRGKASL